MHVPGSPSEASDTIESQHSVTTVRLHGTRDDDGYELIEPIILPSLSTHEAAISLVAADPVRGTVTVHQNGTEEYWQFPLDRVTSLSHTHFEFLFPEGLHRYSSVKKVAALCAIVSAAFLAVLAGVQATDTTKKESAPMQTPDAYAKPNPDLR